MNEIEMTTLESILKAAREEFLEKKYSGASLRVIAKKAGVTTGALYGYFRNKEELFEALVGKEYQYMISLYRDILCKFSKLSPEEQQTKMMEYTMQGISEMVHYMYKEKDTFKMILCCAEGTKYSQLIHEMAALDVEATHDFARATCEIGTSVKKVNSNLEHILTSGMFTAFFELIVHDIPREEADEYVEQMINFYSAGWAKIMGL